MQNWSMIWRTLCMMQIAVIASFQMSAAERTSWGITIEHGTSTENTLNMEIQGINAAEFGYIEVYQYALLEADKLLLLGRTATDDCVLSEVNLEHKQQTIIAQYSVDLLWSLPKARVTIVTFQAIQPLAPLIMVVYANGSVTRWYEESETYLEIFQINQEGQYVLRNQEKIEETNLVLTEPKNVTSPYRHLEYDDSPDGSSPPGPAYKDIATILFSDVNNDGYADILIWKQHYISRKKDDPEPGDCFLEKETLAVMYFQPTGQTFSELTPFSQEQWKSIEGLHFYGYWK